MCPFDIFIYINKHKQEIARCGFYREMHGYRPSVVANGAALHYLRATNEMKKLACPGRDSLSNEIMDCGLSMRPFREVNKLPTMVTPKKMLKTLK